MQGFPKAVVIITETDKHDETIRQTDRRTDRRNHAASRQPAFAESIALFQGSRYGKNRCPAAQRVRIRRHKGKLQCPSGARSDARCRQYRLRSAVFHLFGSYWQNIGRFRCNRAASRRLRRTGTGILCGNGRSIRCRIRQGRQSERKRTTATLKFFPEQRKRRRHNKTISR